MKRVYATLTMTLSFDTDDETAEKLAKEHEGTPLSYHLDRFKLTADTPEIGWQGALDDEYEIAQIEDVSDEYEENAA